MPTPIHLTPGFVILNTFAEYGTMTPAQATAIHGTFAMPPDRLKAEYTKLRTKGMLRETAVGLSVTQRGYHFLEKHDPALNAQPELVPPARPPEFRPLNARHIPSPFGARPEAEFWRTLKSKG